MLQNKKICTKQSKKTMYENTWTIKLLYHTTLHLVRTNNIKTQFIFKLVYIYRFAKKIKKYISSTVIYPDKFANTSEINVWGLW